MRKYFLTGATGTVGSAILERLAATPGVKVVLLIRAESERALQARFESLTSGMSVEASLTPVLGDITLPAFGLSDEELLRVRSALTNVIHSAASVRMNLPVEAARAAAVTSARSIFDLARASLGQSGPAKVEFLSTVGVNGTRSAPLPEGPICESRQFHNTYEEAKAEAELVAIEALRSGIPVTIHRPSMIVGDSRTGRIAHFQIFYYICEFLSGRRTCGVLPSLGGTKLDVVPVDFVVDAILATSEQPSMAGRILNLCSGPQQSLVLDDLRAVIVDVSREAGIPISSTFQIPQSLFGGLFTLLALFSGNQRRRKLAAVPHLLRYLSTKSAFTNIRTDSTLAELGISRPAPGAYIRRVLEYYHACQHVDANG